MKSPTEAHKTIPQLEHYMNQLSVFILGSTAETVYMAVVPIHYKIPFKEHALPTQDAVRQRERGLSCDCSSSSYPQGPRLFFSDSSKLWKGWQGFHPPTVSMNTNTRGGLNASKGTIQSMTEGPGLNKVWYASKSNVNDNQLRLLDSYFGKLRGDACEPPSSDIRDKITELVDNGDQINSKELESLTSYLGKLNRAKSFSVSKDSQSGDSEKQKKFRELRKKNDDGASVRSEALYQNDDEIGDLYLIGVLASINIAVFLFDIASPIRNSEFELFSLPLLYGAKINDLILVGEWWRLVTPMFLHSGVFHVALGCWSLLTFGPQVCRGYGSFTFLLIYILGGISGNLTSFLHTPEPTVGGTGPIFAIIGAWLIYQVQNKDVIAKDVSESLFQKAMLTTALSFILSHFGPIDDWTHLGAVLTGMIYGLLTSTRLEFHDPSSSSRSGQDERIALVRQYANPCKSVILFTICIVFLSSLLFLIEPPLDTLVPEELVGF